MSDKLAVFMMLNGTFPTIPTLADGSVTAPFGTMELDFVNPSPAAATSVFNIPGLFSSHGTRALVKPNIVPRIRWSHPLAKNLVLASVPGVGDLITDSYPNYHENAGLRSGLCGAEYYFSPVTLDSNTTRVSYLLPPTSPLYRIAPSSGLHQFSWFIRAKIDSWPVGSWGQIFMIGNYDINFVVLGNPPNGVFDMNFRGDADHAFSNTPIKIGQWACYGTSLDLNGFIGAYLDGYRREDKVQDATAWSMSWNETNTFTLGNEFTAPSLGHGFQGSIDVLYVFDRSLSDLEHASLAADPYQLLEF